MKIEDARKLPPSAQEEKRKLAIKFWEQGQSQKFIAKIVGVAPETMNRWVKRYKLEGASSLKAKKRGIKSGKYRHLTLDQESSLKKLVADKTPDQLKMSYVLWTRRAVMELVKQETGLPMPIRTVGEYLKRWGYTPQKPLTRAYEKNPQAVKKWLDESYPAIAEQAKTEGAEIHWGDETGLLNNAYYHRSYAPAGKTPTVQLPAKRERISMISTVTNQGKVRFMLYEDAMNAKTLIRFMTRLVKDADRKVFLILDNLRTHHSKPVREWLEDHEHEIEVFFLPSYSPELNPDEYLNRDLKFNVHQGRPARTKLQLKRKTIGHLRKLQKLPKRIMKYFKDPNIAYAA